MNKWILLLILTTAIELITITFRFGFKTSSKGTITNIIQKFNFRYMIHFHHGMMGILLIIVSLFTTIPYGLIFGLALILSDLIHHFIVLKLITGDSEFHLIYRNKKYQKKN